jgi:hypothetical protein
MNEQEPQTTDTTETEQIVDQKLVRAIRKALRAERELGNNADVASIDFRTRTHTPDSSVQQIIIHFKAPCGRIVVTEAEL